jgi:hypothetical protein
MSRLILVPQYPTKLRYQEWWFDRFPEEFSFYFNEIIVLGGEAHYTIEDLGNSFAPVEASIAFELLQIQIYNEMQLKKDDILLLCDLSFPGLFANILFHKRPNRCFAICHATSKNAHDYYAKDKKIKFPIETNQAKLFDAIFVATEYHKHKLNWGNVIVQGFPNPPFPIPVPTANKEYPIISVARNSVQKRTLHIEKEVEKAFNTQIVRPDVQTWEEYYSFLASAKVLLITSKEETYGYQVVDAVLNDCIPIAPNHFSYPELLPKEYLYNTIGELIQIIIKALHNKLSVPELKVHPDYFYQNIYMYMTS